MDALAASAAGLGSTDNRTDGSEDCGLTLLAPVVRRVGPRVANRPSHQHSLARFAPGFRVEAQGATRDGVLSPSARNRSARHAAASAR